MPATNKGCVFIGLGHSFRRANAAWRCRFAFLIYSAQKFRFVAALSYHKKAVRLFIGAALILLPAAGIWALWGYMNTIAILLHLAFFGRLPHWFSLYF